VPPNVPPATVPLGMMCHQQMPPETNVPPCRTLY
jgi:hypothetical protein